MNETPENPGRFKLTPVVNLNLPGDLVKLNRLTYTYDSWRYDDTKSQIGISLFDLVKDFLSPKYLPDNDPIVLDITSSSTLIIGILIDPDPMLPSDSVLYRTILCLMLFNGTILYLRDKFNITAL